MELTKALSHTPTISFAGTTNDMLQSIQIHDNEDIEQLDNVFDNNLATINTTLLPNTEVDNDQPTQMTIPTVAMATITTATEVTGENKRKCINPNCRNPTKCPGSSNRLGCLSIPENMRKKRKSPKPYARKPRKCMQLVILVKAIVPNVGA